MLERFEDRASRLLRTATDEQIRTHVVGALFCVGAFLAALTQLFPHPDEGEAVIWGAVVVATLIGTALLFSDRIGQLPFHLVVGTGSLLINILMLASGVAAGVYAAMFNWVVLVIVNFFSPRAAIAHFIWMVGCYAVVLSLVESGGEYSALSRWIVATLALSVTGAATGWLVFRRRLAEESARRFLDLSQEMLCTIDDRDRLARINPAWARTFGLSEAELRADTVTELIHPSDRDTADMAFGRLRDGSPAELFEVRCGSGDGTWLTLRWSASHSDDEELIYARVRPVRGERV